MNGLIIQRIGIPAQGLRGAFNLLLRKQKLMTTNIGRQTHGLPEFLISGIILKTKHFMIRLLV